MWGWQHTDVATASLRLYGGMVVCMGMFACMAYQYSCKTVLPCHSPGACDSPLNPKILNRWQCLFPTIGQGTAFELQSLEANAKSQEVMVRDAVDKAKESAKKAHAALQALADEQVPSSRCLCLSVSVCVCLSLCLCLSRRRTP